MLSALGPVWKHMSGWIHGHIETWAHWEKLRCYINRGVEGGIGVADTLHTWQAEYRFFSSKLNYLLLGKSFIVLHRSFPCLGRLVVRYRLTNVIMVNGSKARRFRPWTDRGFPTASAIYLSCGRLQVQLGVGNKHLCFFLPLNKTRLHLTSVNSTSVKSHIETELTVSGKSWSIYGCKNSM